MSAFGRIMQNGFVVHDWREAAMHWVDQLGVGPFFVMEHIQFDVCRFRGEPIEIDMSVAIAYTGDYQIELVQQHNDAPSIYREFLSTYAPGLQHVGTLVEDLGQALEANQLCDRVIQDGQTATGQRFAYVDTEHHNGTMLELIETNAAMHKAFAHMRRAAADWDGDRPIR